MDWVLFQGVQGETEQSLLCCMLACVSWTVSFQIPFFFLILLVDGMVVLGLYLLVDMLGQ